MTWKNENLQREGHVVKAEVSPSAGEPVKHKGSKLLIPDQFGALNASGLKRLE